MYRVETDEQTREQIGALPDEALADLAGVIAVLELVPWSGEPWHDRNPDGEVRTLPLGRGGMVTYLILENQQRVDLVNVVWIG